MLLMVGSWVCLGGGSVAERLRLIGLEVERSEASSRQSQERYLSVFRRASKQGRRYGLPIHISLRAGLGYGAQ